jgi:hypothetical protein
VPSPTVVSPLPLLHGACGEAPISRCDNVSCKEERETGGGQATLWYY